MMGEFSPQTGLFDVGNVFPVSLRPGTFYAQLAAAAPQLFRDDEFGVFYSAKMGRPSIPPSQLALMTLLQEYTGCSDAEAVELSAFDMRWAAVLRKMAGEPLCAKSTLQMFRAHLVLHDEVRAIFLKSVAEAKRAGLLKKGSALRIHLDTKPVTGRGAVEDTYNLLGSGIRQLTAALAAAAGQQAAGWAQGKDLGRYFGSSLKGSAEIDWSDAASRQSFLTEVVVDARRLLLLAGEQLQEEGLGEKHRLGIREAAKLLEQLLLQDVEESATPDGGTKAELKRGTSKGRMPSAKEPEQRHGHKSKNKQFTGYKAKVAVEAQSQIITAIDVMDGNAGDSEGAIALVEQSEKNTGEAVAQTTGDCAYGGAVTRQAFAEAGRDFAAKVPQEANKRGVYPKSAFALDLENNTVTCPAQHTTVQYTVEKDGGKVFHFGSLCVGCPNRGQCTASKRGRTVRVHPQEQMRADARAYQETPEGRARFRERVVAEHALARLSHRGIGQSRFRGKRKTRYQLLMAAAVANLRRVWNWEVQQGSGGSANPNNANECALNGLVQRIWSFLKHVTVFVKRSLPSGPNTIWPATGGWVRA